MNLSGTPDHIRTAVHEAGHAVVAVRVGIVPHAVDIHPTGNRSGRVTFAADPPAGRPRPDFLAPLEADAAAAEPALVGEPWARDWGQRLIAVFLAGWQAEITLLGNARRDLCRDDFEVVHRLTQIFGDAQCHLDASRLVRRLVGNHLAVIERVAQVLLERGRLDRETLLTLIGDKTHA